MEPQHEEVIQKEEQRIPSLSFFPRNLVDSAVALSGLPQQKPEIRKGHELEDLLRVLLAKKINDPNLPQEERDKVLSSAKEKFSQTIAVTRPDILLLAALEKCPKKIEELQELIEKGAEAEETRRRIFNEIKDQALSENWDLFHYYQLVIDSSFSKRLVIGYHFPQMLRWICLDETKSPNGNKIAPLDQLTTSLGIPPIDKLSDTLKIQYQTDLKPRIEKLRQAILQADGKKIKKAQEQLIYALGRFNQTARDDKSYHPKKSPEELVSDLFKDISILSDEELRNLALSQKWKLEEYFLYYCNALKEAGYSLPSLPQETDIEYYKKWLNSILTDKQKVFLKKNFGGVLGFDNLNHSLFLSAFESLQSNQTTHVNEANIFENTILQLNDGSIIRYIEKLSSYLPPLIELEKNKNCPQELPIAIAKIRQRINTVCHQTISLILALSDFGAIKLSEIEKKVLSAIPADVDLSHTFGYDKRLRPILNKEERKEWKRKIKEKKHWYKPFINILSRLEGKYLPFIIDLSGDQDQISLGSKLLKLSEEWDETTKVFSRRKFLQMAARTVAVTTTGSILLKQPVISEFSHEIARVSEISFQKIMEELSKSPFSFKTIFKIGKLFGQLKQKFGKEFDENIFAKVGIEYFEKYAEQIVGRFPALRISKTEKQSQLTEKDFYNQPEPPPQTIEELLNILETEQGQERFLSTLTKNFYQLGSFRFADEDRFTFISQLQLRKKLEELVNKLRTQLAQQPEKNLRIDTLNPSSKKQGAVSSWDEMAIEILKYYFPQLSSVIISLSPETTNNVIDWPLEFCRKRQGYLACEQIFGAMNINTSLGIKPEIKISNKNELEIFFEENSSIITFNKKKFVDWLNKFDNIFPDEATKWQFVSWALTLARQQEIDLDLVSQFVDLNRFNSVIKNELSELDVEESSSSALVAGALVGASTQSALRQKISRRDFLKTLAVGAGAAALAITGIKLQNKVESPHKVVSQILERYNGNVWEEVARRLQPILTVNPSGFSEALVIKTPDDREIDRYFDKNKEFIPLDQIPRQIIDFLVGVEDKRFFDHPGIDPVGIVRGFIMAAAGGGSTLTQQLIRLLCFSQEELLQEQRDPNLTYRRKMVEIASALVFEKKWEEYFRQQGYNLKDAKKLTKNKILEIYLNNVPLGPNIYGINAASKFYFDKEPEKLTEIETAFLIGLIQNPIGYNPLNLSRYDSTSGQYIPTGQINTKGRIELNAFHPAMIRLRRDIIPLLKEQGLIDPEVSDEISKNTIVLTPPQQEERIQSLTHRVIDQVLNTLNLPMVFSGLEVKTSIDEKMQKDMEEMIKLKLQEQLSNQAQEAAIIILDGETGAILTAAGAKNDPINNEVNTDNDICFTENYPGSTVKPFTYASALANGVLDLQEVVAGNTYRGISNYNGLNYGLQPWQKALASSLNTSAQQVADRLGALALRQQWLRLGLRDPSSLPISKITTNLTLGTEKVRLIDLAAAFTSIINNGHYSSPTFISQVSQHGQQVFSASPQHSIPIFSPQVAQLIFDALSDPENKVLPNPQTWQTLRDGGGWYFAKTGTETNPQGAQRAVWVVGGVINPYTQKKYIILTYLGTQDNKGMSSRVSGASTLAPTWREIVRYLTGK